MKFRTIAILVLVIIMTLGSSMTVRADDGTATPTATSTPATTISEIEGSITTVDTQGNTILVTLDNGTTVILNINDNTDIQTPGKEIAFISDLQAGQHVEVKYEDASKNALEIEVGTPKSGRIQGEITILDSATNTVTITLKQGEATVLTITTNTKLYIWGKDPATFADLKVADTVNARYNLETKEALTIEVKAKGEPSLTSRTGFFGTVKSKSDTSLTITTKQGDVTLTLDADTIYWNPPQKDTTLIDIKIGDRVAVLVVKQDSTLNASRVLVIPVKPVHIQVTGTVSKIEGNTITLTDEDGNTSNIELSAGQIAKIKVGDVLTLTLFKTPGNQKYIVNSFMRGEELRNRLNKFVERVKNKQNSANHERNMEKLEGLLQRNMERQQQILQKVAEKAPTQAREALEQARENARRGWEQAIDALNNGSNGEPTATATIQA